MALGVALAAILGISFLYLTYSQGDSDKRGGTLAGGANRNARPESASANPDKIGSPNLPSQVDEKTEVVASARDKLRKFETDRIKFTREYEDDGNTYYDFVITVPSKQEQSEIGKICTSVKGLSHDWFNERPVSWSQKLRDEFLFEPQYQYVCVSIKWREGSKSGSYSMTGIEPNQLIYGENGSPASADGKINVIRIGTPFEFNNDWRFAHVLLLDKDP